CAASRAVHAPVQIDAAELECERMQTLVGSDAVVVDGRVVLPADGPAFNIWRLSGGSARFTQGSTQHNPSTEVGRG
ncbi:MAG: hypothetical protein ACKOJG_02440, partial [Actinomycetota bacterium]